MGARRSNTLTYVVGSLDVGGTERHLAMIAPAMTKAGYDVTIYCLTHRGALADEVESKGVRLVCSTDGKSGDALHRRKRTFLVATTPAKLVNFLRRERPQIVHLFLPTSYLLGAPAALVTGVPIRVMSRRNRSNYQKGHPLATRFERLLHGRMTAALGNSQAVVADLLAEGCSPERVGLLYNGVEPEIYGNAGERTAIRRSLNISADTLAIVCVANLKPYKGHDDLLVALAEARPSFPQDCQLLCVGRDDGIGDKLQQRATALGLTGAVRFLGNRNDIPAILAAADIGVLASHEEGFSNAILEMMAARLASVVTDVGGNAEAIHDGVHGLVVPPKSPSALASALTQLARDQILRSRFGDAAHMRAEAEFSSKSCVEGYLQFYDALKAGQPIGKIARFAHQEATANSQGAGTGTRNGRPRPERRRQT